MLCFNLSKSLIFFCHPFTESVSFSINILISFRRFSFFSILFSKIESLFKSNIFFSSIILFSMSLSELFKFCSTSLFTGPSSNFHLFFSLSKSLKAFILSFCLIRVSACEIIFSFSFWL